MIGTLFLKHAVLFAFKLVQKYEMVLRSNQSAVSNVQPLQIQHQSEPVVVTIPAQTSVIFDHEPRAGEFIADLPEQPVTYDIRMGMETETAENGLAIHNFHNFGGDFTDLGNCLQDLQDDPEFALHGLGLDGPMSTDSAMLEAMHDEILQPFSSGDMIC